MPRKKKSTTEEKNKGLFDHINHIRRDKSADYYSSLNETEKKSFNHYMIVRCLSMINQSSKKLRTSASISIRFPVNCFINCVVKLRQEALHFFHILKIKRRNTKIN
jgi:hypothetical protein